VGAARAVRGAGRPVHHGPRESDGVWAPHWYGSVWRSTGFGPYHPPEQALPARLAALADQCQPFYQRLRACRLAVGTASDPAPHPEGRSAADL
jgi:hypothetical protein